MNIAELQEQSLKNFGEYESTWFDNKWYTNLETYTMAKRLSKGLESLGVTKGDRIVMLMPNCIEVSVVFNGIWGLGAVAVPVLFLLGPKEIAYILSASSPKVLITTTEVYEKAKEAIELSRSLPYMICVGKSEDNCIKFAEITGNGERPIEECNESELAAILFTSGTTGAPKGVMLSHGNIYSNALASLSVLNRKPGTVALACLPMAHSYGMISTIVGNLAGMKGVLMKWFDPALALELIERFRVEETAMVPTMLVYLLNHPDSDVRDLSSLQRVTCAAAPLPKEVQKAFEEKFKCKVLQGYGLSEASPAVALNTPEESREGSVGKPLPGVQVKIVNEAGQEQPRGQLGEIVVKGPNVMLGYYNMPEQTAEIIKDGWLYTGDLGYIDEDGFLYVVERKKDLIIRGGFNILPGDIEQTLMRHPAVLEAAVVGYPDKVLGEEVAAFVVTKPNMSVSEEELIMYCQQHIAKFKCPKKIVFKESLPKNLIGKVAKKYLREEIALMLSQ